MEPHSIHLQKHLEPSPRRWPSKAEVLQAIPKVCWNSLRPWGWWKIGKLWVSDLDFSKSAEVECNWRRDCEVAEYDDWMFCFWQGWWAASITEAWWNRSQHSAKIIHMTPIKTPFYLGAVWLFFFFTGWLGSGLLGETVWMLKVGATALCIGSGMQRCLGKLGSHWGPDDLWLMLRLPLCRHSKQRVSRCDMAMDWLPQSWEMQTEFVNLCKMLKSNEKHFFNWIMDSFHLWICLCLHTGSFLWISCVEVHSHASSLVALIQRFSGRLCRTRRLFTEDGSGDSSVDHLRRRSGHIRNWTLGHWSLGLQNGWGLGEMTSFKCSLNRWSKTTLPAGGSMTLIWHDMPPR